MTSLENWNAQRLDRYAKAHAEGMHDSKCEQRERSSLCHCSKRRREARGLTTPPAEDLYFPPPDCPSCGGDLEFDGDGFTCPTCALSWDSNGTGSSAKFDDEYGDDIGGERWGRRLVDLVSEEADRG